jgi:serine protease
MSIKLTLLLLIASISSYSQSFVPGIVYMKTVDTFSTDMNATYPGMISMVATYGIDTIYYPFKGLGNDTLEHTCCIRFTNTAQASQLVTDLKAMSACHYAEQAPMHITTFTPNDPQLGNQWSLQKIEATAAWNVSKGSASKIVAIIDNGVLTTHEDLVLNMWVNTAEKNGITGIDDDLNGYTDDINGYDVADRDGNPNPPTGIASFDPFVHGTHCAGIAAGVTNNGKGIASIGYGLRIMAVKCTHSADSGNTLTSTLDGITYAIRNNANIISMSFGSSSGTSTMETLLNTARQRGIVCVASAGNDNSSTPFYPAAIGGVISVGATDQSDKKASFSNYGTTVDIMAPGVSILSTIASGNTAYGNLSGTSMACPLVAGLAGLILSASPGLSPAQVEANLKSNADNIASLNPTFNGQLGAGRINARKSMDDYGSTLAVLQIDEKQLSVYPNPFYDYIHLNLLSGEIEKVSLFDINGKTIAESSTDHIDTRFLNSGLYILHISLKDGATKSIRLSKI